LGKIPQGAAWTGRAGELEGIYRAARLGFGGAAE
jgi:hypothetical protein